jgi:tetratricopeptide (TPR) repeat protein
MNLAINAERFHRSGDYETSERILAEFLSGRISIDRRNLARVHYLSGRNAAARGDPSGAIERLRRAIEIQPFADAFVALAELEVQKGDRAGAMEHLRSALQLDASNPKAQVLLREIGR